MKASKRLEAKVKELIVSFDGCIVLKNPVSVVFQVVNKKTNCVAYYDKDEEIAKRICDKWNNTKT